MILDRLHVPIVLAPLAGGPSTPQLAAAVCEAGGLGFIAAGYLTAPELGVRVRATREMTAGPIGVNLFVPGAGPAEPAAYAPYVGRFHTWAQQAGVPTGQPRYDDDDWSAKIALLNTDPVEVVSFTFGSPSAELVELLHLAGAEVWVTVTCPDEAVAAEQRGADVLVVQGAEAGGHRGSFVDGGDLPVYGLLPLLDLVRDAASVPLVATGGIATGRAIAAALVAGASAAQIGTALMLAPEAGTSAAHRHAITTSESTVLTRAFTGRLARGIRNEFIAVHHAHAPIAYPEIHYLTAPMRKQAREQGDASRINLWAGQAHQLARELPAAEIVGRLASETNAALNAARTSRRRGPRRE